MKLALALTTLLATSIALTAASGVTYVPHDKVTTALGKGGPLVTESDLLVSGSHRTGPGKVEVHDKETDIMYVIDGEATLVTGGKMIGGAVTKPGQWMGTEIQGGQPHHMTKGDVIVVPAGTPHWFKEVPKSISYYVVKVLKQ